MCKCEKYFISRFQIVNERRPSKMKRLCDFSVFVTIALIGEWAKHDKTIPKQKRYNRLSHYQSLLLFLPVLLYIALFHFYVYTFSSYCLYLTTAHQTRTCLLYDNSDFDGVFVSTFFPLFIC